MNTGGHNFKTKGLQSSRVARSKRSDSAEGEQKWLAGLFDGFDGDSLSYACSEALGNVSLVIKRGRSSWLQNITEGYKWEATDV
jgi:hypothetical protein